MGHATGALARLDIDTLGPVQIAVAGFLARYSGPTRRAYAGDLRQWAAWCQAHGLDPLQVRRPHVELYARWMEEERGNKPASVARRLGTLRSFYAVCEADQIVSRSPVTHVRSPKVQRDELRILGLDRIQLTAFIAAAKRLGADEWAMAVLMGLLGLRVSEACAVRVEDFAGVERGYRVLRLVGKGGKPATIPLPVPVLRAMDAAAGDRTTGPLARTRAGTPMNRVAAARMVKRIAKAAGIRQHVHPHVLRHSMIGNALDAGIPLREVQVAARHSDPRTTAVYDRARHTLDRHAVHILAATIAGAA